MNINNNNIRYQQDSVHYTREIERSI